MPPRSAPTKTKYPDLTPVATWTKTVPGQAPVSAMPMPSIAPPMMFPSYPLNRPRVEAERGVHFERPSLLAATMATLLMC